MAELEYQAIKEKENNGTEDTNPPKNAVTIEGTDTLNAEYPTLTATACDCDSEFNNSKSAMFEQGVASRTVKHHCEELCVVDESLPAASGNSESPDITEEFASITKKPDADKEIQSSEIAATPYVRLVGDAGEHKKRRSVFLTGNRQAAQRYTTGLKLKEINDKQPDEPNPIINPEGKLSVTESCNAPQSVHPESFPQLAKTPDKQDEYLRHSGPDLCDRELHFVRRRGRLRPVVPYNKQLSCELQKSFQTLAIFQRRMAAGQTMADEGYGQLELVELDIELDEVDFLMNFIYEILFVIVFVIVNLLWKMYFRS